MRLLGPSDPGVLGRLIGRLRRAGPWGASVDPRQGVLFADTQAPSLEATPERTPASLHPPSPSSQRPAREPPDEPTSPPELFGPQTFHHPQAQRRIVLQGHAVAYAFSRARRRSIGMSVGPEGLSVRAPRWVTLNEVESALQERAGWIVRHLREQQARGAREAARRIAWAHGAQVPYLGQTLTIVLDDSITGTHLAAVDAAPNVPPIQAAPRERSALASQTLGRSLRVGLRRDASPEAIRDTVHAWLQQQARQLFEARVTHFASLMDVQVKRLSLSAARTRWGSASADGSVRLNWRLVHHEPASIDYVVVHELAHLRHMNHGPAFWRLVGATLPGYEHAKARLHAEAHDVRD